MHRQIPYQYKNLPIPGGGYVTGFLFSEKTPDTLYLRTDIGGTYRYSYTDKRWTSLIPHVTMHDLSETFPAAIALDEQIPGTLYIACGVNGRPQGTLAISGDYGNSFHYRSIPTLVHGNLNGRGTGYRLVVDPTDSQTLYFASQQGGLLRTPDLGQTWEVLPVNMEEGYSGEGKHSGEMQMTLVWVAPNGSTIVAGTAGVTYKKEHMRGHSLYISYDKGATFRPLPMPENVDMPGSRLSGYVAQRCNYDGTYLYLTLSVTGRRSYVTDNGYSCDSGDAIGGKVLKYPILPDGTLGEYVDITPEPARVSPFPEYGFSGITSCPLRPGMLACSTICKDDGDMVFVSFDYGASWKTVLYDLQVGKMEFRAPYMRPECNGGENLIHWLSDLKINPHNPDEAWFNSGTGVFVSRNFTQDTVVFSDWCDGIEETVHLNIYSLPHGEVQVLDILGDLGGFAFRDLTKPCENSFADDAGNRYITCINADFSDIHPETVVVTPRGNWKEKTKGGLILSTDQCKSFRRLPMPFGLSAKTDALLHGIEHPNVNSGWVALSADCCSIVWSLADGIELPADAVLHSQDGGNSFRLTEIYDTNGDPVTQNGAEKTPLFKAFSDRVNPKLMYGFGEDTRIYVSHDGGASFHEKEITDFVPDINFGIIDCANKTEIRAESGKEGILYLALNNHGLWKMQYHAMEDQLSFTRITPEGDIVYRMGLGILREGGDYITEDKAFYICGVVDGEYGFFRSLDQGDSWERINNESQMFGEIISIDGDCRTFGRFYLATGSCGALYGDMV